MKYLSYSLHNFKNIPQIKYLSEQEILDIQVVGSVLPFKTNNYLVDELIDWDNFKQDPMFILTFPQRDMLARDDFEHMEKLIRSGADRNTLSTEANIIRKKLNPHPAGQLKYNVSYLYGERLEGVQHKYRETMLFFPSQGQTCHAYCTFCFRWPQFINMEGEFKFSMKEADALVAYLQQHTEITDLLFTGGDPMIMKAQTFNAYITAILDANIAHLRTIRIGSKSVSFWPYRYLTEPDADEMLGVFKKITASGKSLSFMAHFNHPRELSTDAVIEAVQKIKSTGAIIRTQSPILNHINADADIWARMWQKQVEMGMIPYYMFIPRNTGAQEYFALPIVQAWEIFQKANSQLSGIARTVRGPSMSCMPGKIRVVGVSEVKGEKLIVLEFLQGRNSDWVGHPFFSCYNSKALWIDDLKPAFGKDDFFYEKEMREMMLK